MRPPAPRLRALLAAEGHAHPEERVGVALVEEVRHYRRNHRRGADAESLRELRRECARVLAAGLGGDVPPLDRLTEILVESLRFDPAPDAAPALDALAGAGMALAVVSNWDCSLPGVLEEAGLAGRVAAVSVSAVVGAAKPDPAIFHDALRRLGVPASRAVHCGDDPVNDCAGARAAGVRAVLVDRAGRCGGAPCPAIPSLAELPRFLGVSPGAAP